MGVAPGLTQVVDGHGPGFGWALPTLKAQRGVESVGVEGGKVVGAGFLAKRIDQRLHQHWNI